MKLQEFIDEFNSVLTHTKLVFIDFDVCALPAFYKEPTAIQELKGVYESGQAYISQMYYPNRAVKFLMETVDKLSDLPTKCILHKRDYMEISKFAECWCKEIFPKMDIFSTIAKSVNVVDYIKFSVDRMCIDDYNDVLYVGMEAGEVADVKAVGINACTATYLQCWYSAEGALDEQGREW